MRQYEKPIFTEKHFNTIAQIIKDSDKETLINSLISFFKSDNEKFKESKFRKAIKKGD